MDLFSSQLSPVSDPEVPQLLSAPPPPPYSLRIVKTEPMSAWPYTDPRPYTPQAIDTISIGIQQNELDHYGYSDSPTYLSLSPVEVDATGPSQSFSSEFLSYEYRPFFKMDDDLLTNSNRDEGYVSPTASLHSLTPPSDLRQLHVRDSATDSGNSNDLTGFYEADDHHQSETSTSPPQPPRTQCVKCGSVVGIGQCLKEATGHYLCFACHMQSNPPTLPIQASAVEPPTPRRARKKQSVNARSNQSCHNCGTTETRLWRRDFAGNVVCNACGLYEKLHKLTRPKSMRKDTIQTRRRKPRNAEAKKKAAAEGVASNGEPSTNRVITQPMIIPSHPPPPYNNRFVTIEDPGSYQVLPSMGSLGYLNALRSAYGQFSG